MLHHVFKTGLNVSVLATTAMLLAGPAFAQAPSAELPRAVMIAEEALTAAWNAAPLTLQNVVFIDGPIEGFGMFSQRPDNVFEVNEPIVVYAEPIGFGWIENSDGNFEFGFDVDLLVKTPDGEILGGQEGFGSFRFNSHSRNREITLTLTLTLDDFPVGDYIVEYRVRDVTGPKAGTMSMSFTTVEPLSATAAGPADAVWFFYDNIGSESDAAERHRFADPARAVLDAVDRVQGLCIGFSLALDAQDFDETELDQSLELFEEIDGDHADIFANFTVLGEHREIVWSLSNFDGWKVTDIASYASDWRLSEFECE